MKVTIEILAGNDYHEPNIKDIEKNIEAQKRAVDGKSFAGDFQLLCDTQFILEGIKREIENGRYQI